MFDIGWQELVVIGIVALIVIGPKDLPRVLYTAGRWVRKIKHAVTSVTEGFQQLANQAEIEDMRQRAESSNTAPSLSKTTPPSPHDAP